MLATLINMPKWLLALLALCILTGYSQQVRCKLTGCKPTVAVQHSGEADHDDKSAPQSEDQHCECQCHFMALSTYEMPTVYVSFVAAMSTRSFVWTENAPEAPCADIEHPPQLG